MKTSRLTKLLLEINFCPRQTVNGRVKLQKLTYLLKHMYNVPTDYSFVRYYYGPFSRQLEHDIDILKFFGYISEKTKVISEEQHVVRYDYSLTDKGRQKVRSELQKLPGKELEKMQTSIQELCRLPPSLLILTAKSIASEQTQ